MFANLLQNDDVEEYNFDEEDDEEDEEEDDGRDTVFYKNNGVNADTALHVVTISSDDEKETTSSDEFQLEDRPWKSFDPNTRLLYEQMYASLQQTLVRGDIKATELYQQTKDKEMQEFVAATPLLLIFADAS